MWIPFIIPLYFLCVFLPQANSASDYTTLVYKGCAEQGLSDPNGVYSQDLSSLFGTLLSQSPNAKFFKTKTGSGQTTIDGLFQCRGDLSNADCSNCVSQIPTLMDKLCTNRPVAARIQLYGCYMRYEAGGFPQASGMEMLFKTCSGKNIGGEGFEEARDTALNGLENGIASGNGFYSNVYQSVYVMGQCEGDLGSGDCGDCVRNAVQRAQVECGSSASGQVYLDKCFVTYSYGSNGVPKTSSASSSSSPDTSTGSGQNSGRTAAIILGGAAGVCFIAICLAFARGLVKKHNDY